MGGLNTVLKSIVHFVPILLQDAWNFLKGNVNNLPENMPEKNIGLSNKALRPGQLQIRPRTKPQGEVKISMHSPRAHQLLKNIS